MADGFNDFGIQDFIVTKEKSGQYKIGFEYCAEVRAYSVEQLDGENQVKVTLYDPKSSEAFRNKYAAGEEHQIEGL